MSLCLLRPGRRLALVLPTAVLVACGSLPESAVLHGAPIPTDPASPEQPRLQAVKHWQGLADDHARLIAATLGGAGLSGQPVTLRAEAGSSVFNDAYHELLTSRLVEHGLRLLRAQADAGIEIGYRSQLISFAPGRAARGEGQVLGVPAHELLVSFSIRQGDRLIAQRSDAYYLRDQDAGQYQKTTPPPIPPARTVSVQAR